MRGSFDLGEFFGIAVRVHWSFGLLLAWVSLSTLADTGSLLAAAAELLMIGALFSFVVLHEYGHALTARHFGIRTREITLLPIGGLAQLERMPESPRQELLVALAGPAVNIALAAFFGLVIQLGGAAGANNADAFGDGALVAGPILAMMLRANLAMALFNLLPALPMDGGRVLRAALSLAMPASRATRIASRVARVLAGGMALLGLMDGQILLVMIAAFVWLAAKAEYQQARLRAHDAQRQRGLPRFRYSEGPASFSDPLFSDPLSDRLEERQTANPPGQWTQPASSMDPGRPERSRVHRALIRVDENGHILFRVVEDDEGEAS